MGEKIVFNVEIKVLLVMSVVVFFFFFLHFMGKKERKKGNCLVFKIKTRIYC